MNSCVVCHYVICDEHHIVPKNWGGDDSKSNKTILCPNHHRLLHMIMSIDFESKGERKRDLDKIKIVMAAVKKDKKFLEFYNEKIEPVLRRFVIENQN